MSAPAAPPTVDAFLDHLGGQGYAVGVRERLLAHALLQRLAERGELPATLGGRLLALRPLLARNEHEQLRFADLVTAFASETATPGRTAIGRLRERVASRLPGAAPRRAWLWAAMLTVAVLLAAAGVRYAFRDRAQARKEVRDFGSGGPRPVAAGVVRPVYVPVGTFPDAELAGVSELEGEPMLWWILAVAAALPMVAMVPWVIHRLRLDPYLRALRTDRELHERVLYDPEHLPLSVPPSRVRPVSRVLRQRVAGTREVLDLPATLRATVRAGGALAACFRPVRQTPEYLVLVDRRSPHDHQAFFHELLVGALHDQGVAIDLFRFEGSPAQGCQGVRKGTGAVPRAAASFAQLSTRYGGHRLLLFGDPACAIDPATGAPAEWVRHAAAFPDRAWFTPLPLASWGATEARLDALGFLVLPTETAALETLAEWLASERATLAADPDWPGEFPPALRGNAAAWVARQEAPPAEAQAALLFGLRSYLGPVRFQWLCACAVFPALTWPLTLALGREVLAMGRPGPEALTRGVAALGALPWFRHGRMPDWLREALLDRMEPAFETRIRALVKQRLAAALDQRGGERLAEVALLDAWRTRGTGLARDALLVEFLEKGDADRLAQPLPERMRRFLSGAGGPLRALHQGVVPVLAMFAAMVAGMTAPVLVPDTLEGWWDGGVPPIYPYAQLAHAAGVNDIAFSPDGLWLVTSSPDLTARVWRTDGRGSPVELGGPGYAVKSAAFSPDGRRIVTTWRDNTARIYRSTGTGEWTLERTLQTRDTLSRASFSPDGERVVLGVGESTLGIWRLDRATNEYDPLPIPSGLLAAYTADGGRLFAVSARSVELVKMADATSRGLRFSLAPERGIRDATLSADGRTLVTADGGDMVELWVNPDSLRRDFQAPVSGLRSADLSPGNERIVLTFATGAQVRLVGDWTQSFEFEGGDFGIARFSPDGTRIATTSIDGKVRLWGRQVGTVVAIASCQPSPANDRVARALADKIARARATGVGPLTPVAYGPTAWDSARLGPPPREGLVVYPANDSAARAAATWIVSSWNAAEGRADSVRLRAFAARLLPARGGGLPTPTGGTDGTEHPATVTIGVCGAPAGPAEVTRPPASSAQYLLFYKDINDSTEARAVVDTLQGRGYSIRLVDVRPNAQATEIEQVRYFYAADAAQADSFAPILERVLERMGVQFTPRVANRSPDPSQGPPGQIEVWLPSLRPYKTK